VQPRQRRRRGDRRRSNNNNNNPIGDRPKRLRHGPRPGGAVAPLVQLLAPADPKRAWWPASKQLARAGGLESLRTRAER
jgi:hypothetical protein